MKRTRSFWSCGLRARVVIPLLIIGLSLTAVSAYMISLASERASREHLEARAGAITRAICHLAETTDNATTLQRFVAAMGAEDQVKLVVAAAGDPLIVIASSKADWIGIKTSDLPDPDIASRDLFVATKLRQSRVEFLHDTEGTVEFTVPMRTRLLAPSPIRWANGAVTLHLDARPLMQQEAQINNNILRTLGLVVIMAALCAYGLIRFVVLRPMEQIARVAHVVSGGVRTARIGSTRQDELGDLAADIDAMVEELVRRETLEANAKVEAMAAGKRLESTLAELSCTYFAVDQHSLVSVTDLSGTITHVNDRFCQVSEYSREELIGRNHRLVNSGCHTKSFWSDMWHTVIQGRVWRSEVCNRAKSGALYWVDTTIVPYTDSQGNVTKLVAIRSDITARKQAEFQLSESRERFDLAVRGSSDGIWHWTVSTDEVYYSPRFKELLGFSDSEFPHHLVSFKKQLHPEDAAATWEAVQRHLQYDEPYDVIHRLLTKFGDWRWFRAKGAAIRDDDGVARRMAGSISDITALKTAEERLANDALIDGLTGLPNRRLLLERLNVVIERSKVSTSTYAVLFLDFDRFKLINDSLGHDAGDELLRQIASRLRIHVRSVDSIRRTTPGNTSARLGGDEFVVLLQELTCLQDAVAVGERLLSVLAAPYQLNNHEVYSTASIGIVLGNTAYDRAEDVLRDADTAMYEAKRLGKACQVVFDDPMRERVTRRQRLESDLHRAIEADELHMEYQPIVELHSGAVHSLEALCRWEHPSLGTIRPAEFIPIAEESGLISKLGVWVLRAGCRQFANWQRELGTDAPRKLSLNLSRKQFLQPRLPELIQETLQEFCIEPSSIELEVTEDAFCGNLLTAIQVLLSLKNLGVKLAIDDFGVGSSSFAALHRFPVDTLKIDQTLLADFPKSKETVALIQGLVVIADGLGISLVVEGVENRSQLIALRDLGCNLAQGYHFSSSMPAESIPAFLRQRMELVVNSHDALVSSIIVDPYTASESGLTNPL